MALKGRRLPGGVIVIAVAACVLLGVGIPVIMGTLVQPPPGPPLATLDIRSGEPFTLRFTATDEVPRIFLDMDCDSCSFPVTGAMTLRAGGKTLMTTEISAGDSRDRGWGGTSRKLEQHLLFDAPEQPAGTKVTITGSLLVGPARSNWSTAPVKGAPPPTIKTLRVSVAP